MAVPLRSWTELPNLGDRGRLRWLPPGGQGNGLDAETWAPILRLDASLVDEVLRVLHDDGVPAYAAAAPPGRAADRRGRALVEEQLAPRPVSAVGRQHDVLRG